MSNHDNCLALTGEVSEDLEDRISGSRIQAGLYDWYAEEALGITNQGPLAARFGQTVDCLPDMNNDGVKDTTTFTFFAIDNTTAMQYGIGIGDTDNYLKFDPTDKLQIKVSRANAIHIEYGSDILLEHGGDLKFTSVSNPTACTAALIEIAGNIDAGTIKMYGCR